jgi:hypothetical protein
VHAVVCTRAASCVCNAGCSASRVTQALAIALLKGNDDVAAAVRAGFDGPVGDSDSIACVRRLLRGDGSTASRVAFGVQYGVCFGRGESRAARAGLSVSMG